jgi:hypothetical protein
MAFAPQTREGSSNSIKRGDLKRRLPVVVLAVLDGGTTGATSGTVTFRVQLKNLSGDLNVHVLAGFGSPNSQGTIEAAAIPAGAATMQLTPTQLTPNAGRVFLRPVFQDPTAAQNENHPLPQDLPFGWEFTTEADEVYIDIAVNLVTIAAITPIPISGQIIVEAIVEYNGEWWDIKAAELAISSVILQGIGAPLTIGTGPS